MMRRLLLTLAVACAVPAATADAAVVTTVANGTLTVDGDAAADRLALRATAEAIQVDTGADGTADDTFERAAITRIAVRTGAGDDDVRVAFATTVPTTIETGAGNDAVTGGAGAETILAGDGGDLVHPGTGADTLLLGAGDDTALHTDGRVTIDGQTGHDVLRDRGTDEAEEFTVQASGPRALVVRDLGPAADTVNVEALEMSTAGSGDLLDVGDLTGTSLGRVDADLGVADPAQDAVNVQGTGASDAFVVTDSGDATRITGAAAELRIEHADRITVQGRGGDDRFTAAADLAGLTLEGNEGTDRLRVPSSSANDAYDVQPAGPRVRLNQLSFQAEGLDLPAGAGADSITLGDFTGTGLTDVSVELGSADLKVDSLALTGTAAADRIAVTGLGSFHEATGLPARVSVLNAEPGDRLTIFGREGDDGIDASQMGKDRFQPFLEGGPGRDVLVGSPGQDHMIGGGDADVAIMGTGLDTFTWQAGDGRDIVEGGAGTDFLHMNGTGLAETFSVSGIGSRTRVLRSVEGEADLGGVERVNLLAGDGADSVRVEDLSGTATNHIELELAPRRGTTATDQAQDSVLVNGTFGNDKIDVTGAGHQVAVGGLAARVFINRSDKTDALHVDTRPGADVVSISPAARNLMTVTTA